MANEQTLTGLELRKVVLRRLGWTVGEWESGLYNLLDPDGTPQKHGNTPNPTIAASFLTVEQAWQAAPAVESSVDAALRRLTLEDGFFFWMEGVTKGPRFGSPAYAAIRDIHNPMKAVAQAYDDESLAVAMCQAYLGWKAGA